MDYAWSTVQVRNYQFTHNELADDSSESICKLASVIHKWQLTVWNYILPSHRRSLYISFSTLLSSRKCRLLRYLCILVDISSSMSLSPCITPLRTELVASHEMFGDGLRLLEPVVSRCVAVPGHDFSNFIVLSSVTFNAIGNLFLRASASLFAVGCTSIASISSSWSSTGLLRAC